MQEIFVKLLLFFGSLPFYLTFFIFCTVLFFIILRRKLNISPRTVEIYKGRKLSWPGSYIGHWTSTHKNSTGPQKQICHYENVNVLKYNTLYFFYFTPYVISSQYGTNYNSMLQLRGRYSTV